MCSRDFLLLTRVLRRGFAVLSQDICRIPLSRQAKESRSVRLFFRQPGVMGSAAEFRLDSELVSLPGLASEISFCVFVSSLPWRSETESMKLSCVLAKL